MQLTFFYSRNTLAFIATCFCISPYRHAARAQQTSVYWQLQPYIYTDPRTGILTGMLIETYNKAVEYTCNGTTIDVYVRFQESSLLNVHQNLVYQDPLNVTLFPVFYSNSSNPAEVTHYQVYTSESVSVIAKRWTVQYSGKYFSSFFVLGTFLYFLVLLILAVAIVISLAVSFFFSKRFIFFNSVQIP